MMRSMYASVSGLKVHQQKMDVIGNNISNINTIGFKGSRVTFQEMLSQTLKGSSAPEGNKGGTNPQQIGLGVTNASIDIDMSSGNLQPTGKKSDVAIQGEGFFVLDGEGEEQLFSRAGSFAFDKAGYLYSTVSGLRVLGWVADEEGNIQDNLSQITLDQSMNPKATSEVTFNKNLDATAANTISMSKDKIPVVTDGGYNTDVQIKLSHTDVFNRWKYELIPSNSEVHVEDSTGYLTFSKEGEIQSIVNESGDNISNKSLDVRFGTASGRLTTAATDPILATDFADNINIPEGSYNLRITEGGTGTIELINTDGDVVASVTADTTAAAGTQEYELTNGAGKTVMTVYGDFNSGYTSPVNQALEVTSVGADMDDDSSFTLDCKGMYMDSDTTLGPGKYNIEYDGTDLVLLDSDSNTIGTVAYAGADQAYSIDNGSGENINFYLGTAPVGGDQMSFEVKDYKSQVTLPAEGENMNDDGFAILGSGSKELSATYSQDAKRALNIDVYDPQGAKHSIEFALEKSDHDEWSIDKDGFTIDGMEATGLFSDDIPPVIFNDEGAIKGGEQLELIFEPGAGFDEPQTITLDFSGITQFAGDMTAEFKKIDGYPNGDLQTFSIDTSGKITGSYDNGQNKVVAQLALSSFDNPAGLEREGGLFRTSNNSGPAKIDYPGIGGRGELSPATLEMSNVDLSEQFTEMITAQRGFQASSKLITTSDEMLQQLVNLKR